MTRNEIVELIKLLCSEKQLDFVDDIRVGNSILVLIKGKDCAGILDHFLTMHNLEHTTPAVVADGIGSYIAAY